VNCEHVGETVDMVQSRVCENRGRLLPVFVCAKYGTRTTYQRWKPSQAERICRNCPDWPPGIDSHQNATVCNIGSGVGFSRIQSDSVLNRNEPE
jgi:hypothetical protein